MVNFYQILTKTCSVFGHNVNSQKRYKKPTVIQHLNEQQDTGTKAVCKTETLQKYFTLLF